MKRVIDRAVIEQLQRQIMSIQGNAHPNGELTQALGLGDLEAAFPDKIFPKAAIHELISYNSVDAACTSGFLSVLLSKLLQSGSSCLWISTIPRRSVFPPALKAFGIAPEQIIFVDTKTHKETLWTVEEALKCSALPAVVGELNELSFQDSRRLQLAVEKSQSTGFIHRFRPKTENAVACVTRWKITSLGSELPNQKPGIGFPRWNVDLTKLKNGLPQAWQLQWSDQGLEYLQHDSVTPQKYERKIG